MSNKIDELKSVLKNLDQIVKDLNSQYAGKKAKIISSTYNGQPYGSSKPKLTGKVYNIKYIFVSTSSNSNIGVFLEGQSLSLRLDEIEIIED